MFDPTGPVARRSLKAVTLAALLSCLFAPAARAEDKIGGHFGVVFAPLVTSQDGGSIFSEGNFSLGFPMGITVKRPDKWAFDLEVVPGIGFDPLSTGLTVHPGVLRDMGNHWTAGLRFAIDVTGDAWGFTPLLNKGFPSGDHALFVEAVVPIRFSEDAFGNGTSAIGFGLHFGVGF
jgi:hypothetical protein